MKQNSKGKSVAESKKPDSQTPWTLFWDMNSGGGTKLKPYDKIYIEAPKDEAKVIFYNRFGRNPERVTCTCCGEDYSISEEPTFLEASAFHRGCKWVTVNGEDGGGHYVDEPDTTRYSKTYMTISDYEKQSDVLIIRAKDIKPTERVGTVPEEGYAWK